MIFKKHNHFGLYLLFVLLNLFLSCNPKNGIEVDKSIIEVDSIITWINLSQKSNLELDNRKAYLFKAYYRNKNNKVDSFQNRNLIKIAFVAYKLKDSTFFIKTNKEALKLSEKLYDTLGTAKVHWNYGNYYTKKVKMDSAFYHYYKAYINFTTKNHEYNSGRMLYNMAFIQGRVKNYIDSEILTFQAISKFKPLEKNLNLYQCYNHLGIIYKELKEYDMSIDYYNQSLDYLKKVKNRKTFRERSLNNIGLVYQEKGNLKKAIQYFKKALENDNLKIKNINRYARLVDNLAYNKFLRGDTTNLINEFNTALKIRDSLHNKSGVAISKLHLAEYFAENQDTLNAIDNAKSALDLSKDVKNNRDILASLKLLSVIDKVNTDTYLNEYIYLTDSLQQEERKVRDKFTRIQFETDEYIQETKELSKQRNWIIITSFLILAIVSLLYFIRRQKAKNRELKLEQEQQDANEEIYNLMLSQQSKMQEGKLQERKRISEDLHDGVLGKLFGTRLGLGFLDIGENEESIKKHKSFLDEMQSIENEIRSISHELKNELLPSDHNYIKIINLLLEKQSEISGFECKLSNDDLINWDTIDNNVKINIYRIIQEAIQNINRHAKASMVNINFSLDKEILHLTIKDDGEGFDVKKVKKGIGLKNMASRAQKLAGTFKINSNIDQGTTIEISIPI